MAVHTIASEKASEILEEIAKYLEFKNENPFKVRAIANASRILKGKSMSLNDLIESGESQQTKGIGKGILEKLQELLEHGKSLYLEELHEGTPAGLRKMLQVPGLGPKKVRVLFDQLKIENLAQLEKACLENKLQKLKGFGEKTAQNILQGIEFLKKYSDRHLFDEIYPKAKAIEKFLKNLPETKEISLAGSLRRHLETVKDIDIVVATAKPEKIMEAFTTMESVQSVTNRGETKSAIILKSGIRADLRAVTQKEFPYALHHFTGSKAHNTAMRSRAKAMGYKMNEYGLFKGEKSITCKDETEIFKKLGLHYIPPELREDMGEITEAKEHDFKNLVDYGDIEGVFHVHTTYSDGRNTLEEMLQEAVKRKYKYLGISDHSQSAFYANGLKPDTVRRQGEEIARLQEKYPQIQIFHGIESDILKTGKLDYSEKILEGLDFVIASIHDNFKMPEKEMTERVLRAIQNPFTTMLGHPTGRLLLAREPFAVNMEAVIEAAVKQDTVIEINANPHRFDLDWRLGGFARKLGLTSCINPDAHNLQGFDCIPYGVGIARKAGFLKNQILNTQSLIQVKKFLEYA